MDDKVWDLFEQGLTKGIFQLESNLGRSWSKKVKPRSIEEIAGLISIIRPGVLKAKEGNKTLAQKYVDRKAGKEEIEYIHPSLEPILEKTYGILCIHEDTMVSMADGSEKPIKNLRVNDEINSINQETLKCQTETCDDICVSPKRDGVKITLENGWSIVLTEDHGVYTQRGKVAVCDLKDDDVLQFAVRQSSKPKTERMPIYNGAKWAYLLGDKHEIISDIIMSAPFYIRRPFLAGLFDANGHSSTSSTGIAIRRFCPTNNVVSHQIRKLLSLEGINCCLDKEERHLYVLNTERFDQIIGPHLKLSSKVCDGLKTDSYPKDCSDILTMKVRSITPVENQTFYSISVSNTHNLIANGFVIANCYQEQSMRIAQDIAGFSEQDADILRKAMGKKDATLMAKVKKDFIEGCKRKAIVDEETADEIFGWIEKSSRYSFNKSHGIAYAINSYRSALLKATCPKEFFTAYLHFAQEKQDPHQEVYELISEAKLFNIDVKLPKFTNYTENFSAKEDGIYFGIKNIKGLTGKNGDKAMVAIHQAAKESKKKLEDFTWLDVLIYISPNVTSTVFKALCSIGFFSTVNTNVSRNKSLYEYLIFKELTKAEKGWVKENYNKYKWNTLVECFTSLFPTKKMGGGTSNANRSEFVFSEISMLKNPPYSLDDDPAWIVETEKRFLGCPVSISQIEAVDTSVANTTCKDVLNGKTGKDICITASVVRANNFKIKKEGKNKGRVMMFLTIEDTTCSLDSVIVFPDTRDKYQYFLYEGNNLMLCGKVEKDGSFIVDKVHEL